MTDKPETKYIKKKISATAYLGRSARPSAAWSLSCSCTQSCRLCSCKSARSRRFAAHTRRCLGEDEWNGAFGETHLTITNSLYLGVQWFAADLCTFFHRAAAWSQRGSCSARLWMCPYRCSRTHHCSRRRSLKVTADKANNNFSMPNTRALGKQRLWLDKSWNPTAGQPISQWQSCIFLVCEKKKKETCKIQNTIL